MRNYWLYCLCLDGKYLPKYGTVSFKLFYPKRRFVNFILCFLNYDYFMFQNNNNSNIYCLKVNLSFSTSIFGHFPSFLSYFILVSFIWISFQARFKMEGLKVIKNNTTINIINIPKFVIIPSFNSNNRFIKKKKKLWVYIYI